MFKNIVVPIDLSDKKSAGVAISHALNFANVFNSKIHMVYIMPDFGVKMVEEYLPKNWVTDQKDKNATILKELIDRLVPSDIEIESYIGRGAIYDQVLRYSDQVRADLVIVSAVRVQLRDYMLGPNASKIVRHSRISVMVIRD